MEKDNTLRHLNRAQLLDRLYDVVQQKEMLDEKKHYVKDRIVNLAQPWIRPIVRGKAKAKTEFGAKISISVVNGYTFLDRMSFDAYNEGDPEEFILAVELYRKRFGCYPERILADKIYRSRKKKLTAKNMVYGCLGRNLEDLRKTTRKKSNRNFGRLENATKWKVNLVLANVVTV